MKPIARSTRGRGNGATAVRYRLVSGPEGDFFFALREGHLVETGWVSMRGSLPKDWQRDDRLAPALAAALKQALAGKPADFSAWALPKAASFTAACRRAAQQVPVGSTLSYAELARRAGSSAAARAAGQAMRRNPTPIVVPCHRVVAADGGLGGFAGATKPGSLELDVKARLLERERRIACQCS